MEVGIYIDFIPNSINQIVNPSEVTPYDCEFRKRLTYNKDDCWWNYGNSDENAIESINSMVKVFNSEGLTFFKQFEDFPEPIKSINILQIDSNKSLLKELSPPMDLRLALTVARVNLYCGDLEKTKQICSWALERIEKATALIPLFEGLGKGNFV